MSVRKSFCLIFLGMFICTVSVANAQQEKAMNTQVIKEVTATDRAKDLPRSELAIVNNLMEKLEQQRYANFQEILSLTEENNSLKISNLRAIINEQSKKIEELSKTIEIYSSRLPSNENNFGNWISILLACVTVIVTILGVIIAILSFFGYKKAKEVAAETAKLEIQTKVKKGEFDDAIKTAIEKIAFQGIMPGELDEDN